MATYRINVGSVYSGSGGPGVNVFHLRTPGLLPGETQAGVDVLEDYFTALAALFPNTAVFTVPDEVIKDPYGSPEYEAVDGWSVTGTGTAGYAPAPIALVTTWRTVNATRSGRGRTFLGPLGADVLQSDGTPSPTAISIAAGAATSFIAAFDGIGGGAFGVYSRTDEVIRDIISSAVRDRWSVLRSRRD